MTRLDSVLNARLAAVTTRLQPLGLLAQQDIPCLIFGDDALALVFWVPTAVSALHIVVANDNMDRAVKSIASSSSIPYERFGPDPGPHERSDFANSVYLKTKDDYRDASWIIVHPETAFGLAVGDFTRSTEVDVFPGVSFHKNIRLPRPHVMVDAIIDTLLEHGRGLLSIAGGGEIVVRLASIIAHGFRVKSTVPGEGKDAQTMLGDVKKENREYFGLWIRCDKNKADLQTQREHRKAIMDCNAI